MKYAIALLTVLSLSSTAMAANSCGEDPCEAATRGLTKQQKSCVIRASEELKNLRAENRKLQARLKELEAAKPSEVVHIFHEVKEVQVEYQRKNRIRLLGGVGPTGTDATQSPIKLTAAWNTGFVAGLGYSRLLNRRWSVSLDGLTNGTAALGVGFDF